MRPLDGYPTSWGSSRASVFPHAGPAAYVVVTVGVPPVPATGGDEIEAVEAGFKLFDFLVGGVTDSGQFRVDPIPVNQSGTSPGQQSTTYRLKWTALVTASIGGESQTANAEAAVDTDLSAEVVRLLGIGYK